MIETRKPFQPNSRLEDRLELNPEAYSRYDESMPFSTMKPPELSFFIASIIMKYFIRFTFLALLMIQTGSQSGDAAPEKPLVLQVSQRNHAGFEKAISDLSEIRLAGEARPVVIEIPEGVYRFTKTITLNPELVGNGLEIRSRDNEKVTFSGAVLLSPGLRDSKNNWRYELPSNWNSFQFPRVILLENRLTPAARYPNTGYLRIAKALPDRRSGFTASKGEIPSDFELSNSVCDLVLLHDWSSSRLPVASWNQKTQELKTTGPIGCSAAHYAIDHFEKQPRFWLEGHPQFADLPGEWYLDQQANQLVVVGSKKDKKAPKVSLPFLTEILIARGTEKTPLKNLTLRGITFTGANFPMPAGGLAGAQATMHEPRDASGKRTTKTRPMLQACVKIERAQNCQLLRCHFHALGGTALWLAGQTENCLIKQCQIKHVGGNGINLGEDSSRRVNGKTWYHGAPEQVSKNNKVDSCQISHCGEVLPGAVGIWAAVVRNLEISNNHLHDTPYTGISLGWIWNPTPSPAGNNSIRNNKIEYVMQVLSDGGGIYTLGAQPGSVIENNSISDVPLNAGRAESNGMFLDEGSTGFTIRNNTIRRVDRSPLRFHKAGKNVATGNHWELATSSTPELRFNNTPKENISATNNEILKPQKQIFLIGNSLTWDTIPSRLDERVAWHVDCGKSLKYIYDHPEAPCVSTSRNWPVALKSTQYDTLCFQPHYGADLEEDVAVISKWISMQKKATIIIHTGWARHANLIEEWNDKSASGSPTHSKSYINGLIAELKRKHPNRTFKNTQAMDLLFTLSEDIKAKKAPLDSLDQLYRDSIHMTLGAGRYLMHNAMRKTLGQPMNKNGFSKFDPELQKYLDTLLEKQFTQ